MISMISTKEVLSFWFGDDANIYRPYWFDQSADAYITTHFSNLLSTFENEEKNEEKKEEYEEYETKLVKLIVLDQFSRSIYRGQADRYKNDAKAFALAQELLHDGHDAEAEMGHRIFMLMPFRHQRESHQLDVVMEKLKTYDDELKNNYTKKADKMRKMIDHFRRATISSYTPLTDRIERRLCEKNDDDLTFSYSEYNDVLDSDCLTHLNQMIDKHSSYEEYAENYERDIKSACCTELYKTLNKFITRRAVRSIGVSLSGGVDSMVIMFLLRILQLTGDFTGDVYALHLEYCNREESPRETKFIEEYCHILSVPLYVRAIDYIRRDDVDRSFYEEETKKVRFATYNYLSKKHNIDGWCMGHHYGDVSENVMMNLFNGRDLLDLSVMKEDCVINDATLYRPFIAHPKSEIYTIARQCSVPYLKDTTPDWSCRGVLRRKVVPSIEHQWPMIHQTLASVAQQSAEWSTVVEQFVMEPLKRNISIDPSKKSAELLLDERYKELPKVVWMNLFLHLFHHMSICMMSHKNLDYFLQTFTRNWEKQNRFMFSNNCIGFFMKDRLRIVRFDK